MPVPVVTAVITAIGAAITAFFAWLTNRDNNDHAFRMAGMREPSFV